MKKRFFYAAETHRTWPKLFVLTEDNKFYCEYLDYMKSATIVEEFDFSTFKDSDYSYENYQSIVEITEDEAKSKTLTRQPNWIQGYLNSL